jgi:stalled ribosome rescue protein Dom34
MSHHAIVWLDHSEAKVFQFSGEGLDERVLAAAPHHHLHHRANDGHRPGEDQTFFHSIAATLAAAREILVVGPGSAKLGFVRHLHKHDHELEPKVVGVETVDHPTDGQIVAYAKKYFRAKDHMV